MAGDPFPSPQYVALALRHCPDTGILYWNRRSDMPAKWNGRWEGMAAGSMDSKGYVSVRILWRRYRAHRVAWCIMSGSWPDMEIDHINGDRADNRPSNLRLADHSENGRNRGIQSNNTSGFKGVSWHSGSRKWLAQIVSRGRHESLGLFSDPKDAYAAYCQAAHKQHGAFANISNGV